MGGGAMGPAGRADHLGGVPRALVFMAVGAFAKVVTSLLNSTSVHNADTLIRLVRSRPPGRPLITVSNHMSTLDDPLMWGFKGFPTTDAKLARWVLAAEDICFKNAILSYIFRLGKCIPTTRGGGIYQAHLDEALEVLSGGGWLHTFPEGKVSQANAPIRRLKWGTASLIVRAPVTPIVLPIVHCGFEKVMPEKFFFGRRPVVPLCKKDIKIIIGEPIEFDLQSLKQTAKTVSRESCIHSLGWPNTTPDGLDEAAQKWLYINISDQIRTVMERLRSFGATLKRFKGGSLIHTRWIFRLNEVERGDSTKFQQTHLYTNGHPMHCIPRPVEYLVSFLTVDEVGDLGVRFVMVSGWAKFHS